MNFPREIVNFHIMNAAPAPLEQAAAIFQELSPDKTGPLAKVYNVKNIQNHRVQLENIFECKLCDTHGHNRAATGLDRATRHDHHVDDDVVVQEAEQNHNIQNLLVLKIDNVSKKTNLNSLMEVFPELDVADFQVHVYKKYNLRKPSRQILIAIRNKAHDIQALLNGEYILNNKIVKLELVGGNTD